jgi:O-antigen/teichoic acid export membrane protein
LINKILKSSLFKASGLYTLFSIINSAVPFLLLPVLTRHLSPQDYGIVAMFSILISIVGVFTGLSVNGAVNRVYFDKTFDFKEYVANVIYILIFSSSIVLVVVFLFKDYISDIIGVPVKWVVISVIYSFFQFIILVNLVIYQARLKAKEYGFLQISQSILNFFLTIIFVVFLNMKWEGRLFAQFLSVFIIGVVSFIMIKKFWTKWKFNKEYIIHALKFGIPLIPHTVGGMLMVLTDRFIINNLLGTKEVGIYTVGFQIGMIIGILADSFNRAWAPWLFNKLNENNPETKLKIVKFTYLYFIGIIAMALSLGLTAPLILKVLVGEDFYEAQSVVLWIALGYAFNGMYYMVTNYIFYVYKTQILTFITFFCGLLNIPLTYFLTKLNGIIGTSQAYAIILFLFFLFTWILSQRLYKMPWRLRYENN